MIFNIYNIRMFFQIIIIYLLKYICTQLIIYNINYIYILINKMEALIIKLII